jgi:FixJ family two-component response regulator
MGMSTMVDGTKTNTVYLVDSDPAGRDSLAMLLSEQGFCVESFDSAEAFLRYFSDEHPGCLLADMDLPGISGLDLLHTLNGVRACLPIIFLSAYGDVKTAVQSVREGAFDYLEKPCDPTVLFRRINEAFELDAQHHLEMQRSREVQHRFDSLSGREHDVMAQMLTDASTIEIGEKLSISPRTVEIHRSRVLHKMQVDSVSGLILLVSGTRCRPQVNCSCTHLEPINLNPA